MVDIYIGIRVIAHVYISIIKYNKNVTITTRDNAIVISESYSLFLWYI